MVGRNRRIMKEMGVAGELMAFTSARICENVRETH